MPLTAFDLLSYAAGLTPMRLAPFLVATAVGMTPATFLMAWAGDIGGRGLGPARRRGLGLAALARHRPLADRAARRARSTSGARPEPGLPGAGRLRRARSSAPGADAGTVASGGRAT